MTKKTKHNKSRPFKLFNLSQKIGIYNAIMVVWVNDIKEYHTFLAEIDVNNESQIIMSVAEVSTLGVYKSKTKKPKNKQYDIIAETVRQMFALAITVDCDLSHHINDKVNINAGQLANAHAQMETKNAT